MTTPMSPLVPSKVEGLDTLSRHDSSVVEDVEAVRVRRIAVIAEPAPANNCPGVTRYVCVSGPVRHVG